MKKVPFLFIVLSITICSLNSWAEELGRDVLKQELETLKAEFQQMKAIYGKRIEALEERLRKTEEVATEAASHKPSPVGSYGGIMNPDISAIIDAQMSFTDEKNDSNRNKVRIRELELAYQGYLYPSIRADVISALELSYKSDHTVDVEVDLEEAYVSFLHIPYVPLGLQVIGGRKFLDFGKLNPIHPHHWPFADTPLAFKNFFGEHNWFDDGVQLSALIPNPWDAYLKTTFGYWNGRPLAHGDGHHHHNHVVEWHGHIYHFRPSLAFSPGENDNLNLGYSLAWDEGARSKLHGGDFTYWYQWPQSYRKFKWQNELLFYDNRIEDIDSLGLYSLALLTLDKYWEVGIRFDWSQFANRDDVSEWAITPFLSRYLTHSTYLRGQYRFRDREAGKKNENAFFLQLVWGLGPHAHRLSD